MGRNTPARCDAHRVGRQAKEARGAGADHRLQAVEGGVAAAAVVAVRIALRHCRRTETAGAVTGVTAAARLHTKVLLDALASKICT
jgi:hypothetical protein